MSVTRVANRYAKSLVELSMEQDKLDRVLQDVESFRELTENRDFYLFIKSPIIDPSKKEEIIDKLFADRYDDLTMAFLRILIKKGREEHLPEIAEKFVEQYRKQRGITTARLTTAVKLDDAARQKIIDKLIASKVASENIDLTTVVDEAIIGGYILEFGDRMFDASVKSKLEDLKKTFEDNLYVSQIIAR